MGGGDLLKKKKDRNKKAFIKWVNIYVAKEE